MRFITTAFYFPVFQIKVYTTCKQKLPNNIKNSNKIGRTRNKVLTKFYFCKEKWVLGSPSTHFQSFSNISLFSKILKKS